MMGPEEVAKRVQDRCWPIIRGETDATHEERVQAFLEMTATISTYCDVSASYVDTSLRQHILGEYADRESVTQAELMKGTNMLHLIADAMATGVNLKDIKHRNKEGHS